VTEEAYRSCDPSLTPLLVWRDSSVDQIVRIEHLMAGSYYFLCSVAGHCSAGMKIKASWSYSPKLIIPAGFWLFEKEL